MCYISLLLHDSNTVDLWELYVFEVGGLNNTKLHCRHLQGYNLVIHSFLMWDRSLLSNVFIQYNSSTLFLSLLKDNNILPTVAHFKILCKYYHGAQQSHLKPNSHHTTAPVHQPPPSHLSRRLRLPHWPHCPLGVYKRECKSVIIDSRELSQKM